ncbi:cytochrome P450 76AD1-like [Beta vulgaris subsp. vulgaris]|uniref:cytochrome P450 76AD1-like n=1 Tax=Beta vulgaris subsp. vulgaris TaxID=3555 RepID=UPI00053F8704|nr:cytochrome P450 76AD1-like [Beta vulgaris subsp. vulgaris]
MELIMLLIIIIFTIIFVSKKLLSKSKSKLPPGPKPWPIIGNIHQLGNKPHRSAAELSKTYGPIMSLKLGSVTTIVISSPEIAQEMFLKHDLAFSGRMLPHALTATNHHEYSVAFLPICPRWRNLRKIATVQLFTSRQLDASQALRQKKVNELVEFVQQCCETGVSVDIGKAAFTTTLNLLANTFFSMDVASHVSSESQEFKDLVWNVQEEGARPNVSDFFPLVKNFDLQGVYKRSSYYLNKMLRFFEEIIDARLSDPMAPKDDVLGILLKLVEDEELNLNEVKHNLVGLFIAGTSSTSNTLEWAMTELLLNPEKMKKAQTEIDQILGKDAFIQESDISKLPYIQAIAKETHRMHPATPFLIPHKAVKDDNLWGYFVPKNTQIWVNVWSIGYDPSIWINPHSFSPERFLNKETAVKDRV